MGPIELTRKRGKKKDEEIHKFTNSQKNSLIDSLIGGIMMDLFKYKF
jgi:hypothetical protein